MDHEPTMRSDRRAHAAQAGLAALVAGSLLAFSLIAFHTALTGDTGPGVKAERPNAGTARPVVLPASPGPVAAEQAPATGDAAAVVAAGPAADAGDLVLGTREVVDTTDTAPERAASLLWQAAREDEEKAKRSKVKQTGHEKARGKGHHKNDHNGRHDVSGSHKTRGHGKSQDDAERKQPASRRGRSGRGHQDETKSRGRSREGGRGLRPASKASGRSSQPSGNPGTPQDDKRNGAPAKGKKGR